MAFGDTTSNGGGDSNPWARRAQEPLVPMMSLAAVKKSVLKDLREIQKASDEIAKLRGSKRPERDVQPRLLQISQDTRERARETSQTIRKAFATVEDGSSEHTALTSLSEDFKATLRRFQLEAEAAAPPSRAPLMADSSSLPSAGPAHVVSIGDETESRDVAELQAVALNEDVIAERERGIANIHRTVHEVAEIFQDLALLVQEQGEHIDNIQTNVESAAMQTSRGVRELAKANRSQRKARSRLCCIAVLLIVVLIILIMVLKFAFNMSFR